MSPVALQHTVEERGEALLGATPLFPKSADWAGVLGRLYEGLRPQPVSDRQLDACVRHTLLYYPPEPDWEGYNRSRPENPWRGYEGDTEEVDRARFFGHLWYWLLRSGSLASMNRFWGIHGAFLAAQGEGDPYALDRWAGEARSARLWREEVMAGHRVIGTPYVVAPNADDPQSWNPLEDRECTTRTR